MEISDLSGDLRFLSAVGTTLNIEERLQIELALQRLMEQEHFEEVKLWGKVQGVTKDYYISMALNYTGHYEFPHKRFFWSSDNFLFAELPPVNLQYVAEASSRNELLTGEHDRVLVEAENKEEEGEKLAQEEGIEKPPEVLEYPSSEEEEAPPPKNFTELDLLAYIVRAIEEECQLVPIGAYKMIASHELRTNENFRGLLRETANNLSSYQHFRNVKSREKREMLDRDDALFRYDFLDPIAEDVPRGCWSL